VNIGMGGFHEMKGKEVIRLKKSLFMFSMMLILAITAGGCATRGDLERVETQEKLIGAKADQAAQDAQAAKAAADAAALKANQAAAKAEEAVKKAEERERLAEEKEKLAEEKARLADEKAKQAEAAFQKSMRK